MNTNSVMLQGKIKRMDYKFNKTKDGREFVSALFTLSINDNEIRVESFSMRHKKDGNELSSYQGLMTLFNEAKCLHKTVKEANMEKAEIVEDETIVENIEDADALDCGNYKIRYTRFEENSYEKDGQIVKNIRIQTTYPRRVDFEKTEYKPKADFVIAGKVKQPPIPDPIDGEFVKMVVTVPIYQEGWGDRKESVSLHDIAVETRDPNAFDYVMDNFEKDTIVYLEGSLLRVITQIEVEPAMDDEGRGFGSCKYNKEPKYKTKIDEAFIIEGGYPLDPDEIELEKAFNEELWLQAEQQQPKQEKTSEIEKTWGRKETKVKEETKPKNDDIVPF